MTTAQEAAAAKTQLGGDLAAGVNTLSLNQSVTFTKYIRLVLPLDGFIFWIKADLVSPSAIFNGRNSPLNSAQLNQPQKMSAAATYITVQGSLHYSTAIDQAEDSTVSVNQIIFTALGPVNDFDKIAPNEMYIATYGPDNIQFAFSQRKPFYQQAGLYHYVGNALYSTMDTQVVNSLQGFDTSLVVSNSLPFWLAIQGYNMPWCAGFEVPPPLFPSFAVPTNLEPPYGVVHIDPGQTQALGSAPVLSSSLSHNQLTRDTVRITLYGVRNAGALNFLDLVNQYSLDTDAIGIMNMPVFRDEKKTQAELAILAMKKTAEFEISYFQSTARSVAQQIISQALVTFEVAPPVVDPSLAA